MGVDVTSQEKIISRLEKLSLLYNNVAIRGSNIESINGKPDERFSNPTVEYCQLSEESRVVRRNRPADGNTRYDQYLVASPDISFIAKRFDDGKQEIQQLSPRRGMEYDSVFFAGLPERYMALHAYSVYGRPLSHLIARRQLQMRTIEPGSGEFGLTFLLAITLELEGENGGVVPIEGELELLQSDCRVLSFRAVNIESGGAKSEYEKQSTVTYANYDATPAIPIFVSVETIHSSSGKKLFVQEFSNISAEFGTVVPADFTLEGCGITAVSTTGASRSIIVWYVLNVGVLGAVLYLLVRRSRTKTNKADPQ